jgi:succinyl-CoA synthetase beta subunit
MNIHEYQAKQLLAKYGVSLPRGGVAFTPEEAEKVAGDIGGTGWAVKAQILAGDRGRAGGVKLVRSVADVRETAAAMLGTTLTTPQTGADGERVTRVYVEQACDIARELYLGMAVDRVTSRVTLMSSTEGGTDIEEVAAARPESVRKLAIDPDEGLLSAQARAEAEAVGLEGEQVDTAERIMIGMYAAFVDYDASLVEVNPMVVTRAGDVLALDAKISIDDNALFRHKEIEDLRDAEEQGKLERARHGFNYLKLPGKGGAGHGDHGHHQAVRRGAGEFSRRSTGGEPRGDCRRLPAGAFRFRCQRRSSECHRRRHHPLRRRRRRHGRGLSGIRQEGAAGGALRGHQPGFG